MEFGARDVLYLVVLLVSVGATIARVSGRMAEVESVQRDHARRLGEVAEEVRRQRDSTSDTREELAEMRGQLEHIGQNVVALQGEMRGMPAAVAAMVTASLRVDRRTS